jgi:hypothetical protein
VRAECPDIASPRGNRLINSYDVRNCLERTGLADILCISSNEQLNKSGHVVTLLICICICYVEENRPPLWSSGQSSWLHNGDVLCFL